MVVAWRVARLMRLKRSCPDWDAQLIFELDEWKAACILDQKMLSNKPPILHEVMHLMVRLKGFLARKGADERRVNTIRLGVQRVLDFAACIRFSRELQAQGICV